MENVPMMPGIGGLVISASVPDRITAKVMEIVEALGLPDKQEMSVKNLIKKVIYEETGYPHAIWIDSEKFYQIRKELETMIVTGSLPGTVGTPPLKEE